jgi:Tfp pilus assembly protein PilO
MGDFARMPLSRKILLFVVIGALGGLLYWQFAYKPLVESVEAAENENRAKAAQNKKLAEDLPKFEELKSRMKELTATITENQKALPTEAEVPAFFETLERKIQESGVEILKWTKLPEGPVESFVRVPVAIEISGTYMQIKRFFASLIQRGVLTTSDTGVEERERVISIEGLSLVQPRVVNRELVMTAKFVAVTFRQEDKSEAPPIAPGAAPAGGGTTAPLPGASTPAGAKARVEESIDKGDKIDRNAAGVEEAKTPAGAGSAKLKGGM